MLLKTKFLGPSGNPVEFELDIDQEEDDEQLIERLLPAHAEHQKGFSRILIFVATLIFVTLLADPGDILTGEGAKTFSLLGVNLPYERYLICFIVLMTFLSVPYSSARLRTSETFNMITGLSLRLDNGKNPFLTIPIPNKEDKKFNRHNFVSALMHGGFHSVKALSDNVGEMGRDVSRCINTWIFHLVLCFLPVIGIVIATVKLLCSQTRVTELHGYPIWYGNTGTAGTDVPLLQYHFQTLEWWQLLLLGLFIAGCLILSGWYSRHSFGSIRAGIRLHIMVVDPTATNEDACWRLIRRISDHIKRKFGRD
ncbi:hypothetical protein [Nitratireductor sp. XY-223]|uniref:hypothetical protein n=1 Tax=Nitratireductor sp. XY-223 TaxID=2561926 RepID=UPI0010AB4EE7|nr:hypothetical protein [Nitratireductor sp. XY-223]